jgi:hypothetical protein
MTDSNYQEWWQLHIRTARGEPLSPEEQMVYQAGVDELDHSEVDRLQLAPLANLRQLREQIHRLTQSLAHLTTVNEQLNRQIATLEQSYQQLTGYPLLIDAHVTRQV